LIALSSISKLHNRTVVRLELPLGGPLSKSIVASINTACDSVEDAGTDAIFVVHLKPTAEAAAKDVTEAPVNVALVNIWERALRRLERIEATTVAIAEGACGGLGTALLLTTDYRIGGHDMLLSLVGADGNIMPDISLYRLANQVGAAVSRRLGLFGSEMTAAQTQAVGLIDELAVDADACVDSFAKSLAVQHARDLFIRRRLMLDAPWQSYDECLGSHLAASDRFLRKAQAGADQACAGSE
jgi:isomerase DpgB